MAKSKRKKDKAELKRLSEGRKLALGIVRAKRKKEWMEHRRSASSEDLEQIANLHERIVQAKIELDELGYDVEATLNSAEKLLVQLEKDEANSKSLRSGGVGVYSLGSKQRNWK